MDLSPIMLVKSRQRRGNTCGNTKIFLEVFTEGDCCWIEIILLLLLLLNSYDKSIYKYVFQFFQESV